MSRMSEGHWKLSSGRGFCSVPLWQMGCPAGFCNKTAYGDPIKGRYDGYVNGLACPNHGGPRVTYKMDGNMWCAHLEDFTNLQESPAGFGETKEAALENFHVALGEAGLRQ